VALPPGLVSYAFAGPRRVETPALSAVIETGLVARAAELPADIFDRSNRDMIEALRRAPARRSSARRDDERILMRALARIDGRPSGARLATIAHDLGYTTDGFTRLLRRHTGRGFAQ
jgi:hypothetical protein